MHNDDAFHLDCYRDIKNPIVVLTLNVEIVLLQQFERHRRVLKIFHKQHRVFPSRNLKKKYNGFKEQRNLKCS